MFENIVYQPQSTNIARRRIPITSLDSFSFPIKEENIYYNGKLVEDYKMIVHGDTNEVISIVQDTYQVIPNSSIISSLKEEIKGLDYKIAKDSYLSYGRMQLHLTFPEYKVELRDGSSIELGLYVNNSYDYSEGFRIFIGGIRDICVNGSVFGEVFKYIYHRHTKYVKGSYIYVKSILESAKEKIPEFQEKVELLQQERVNDKFKDVLLKLLGLRMLINIGLINKERQLTNDYDLWTVYSKLTEYLTHNYKEDHLRQFYLRRLSQAFKL